VCFAKHTLSKHNLGWLGLKPRPSPLFFVLGAGSSPTNMGLVGPSRPSLVTGQQAHVNQLTRALYNAKVIKLPSHCFLANTYTTQREGRRLYLAKTKAKITVRAPAGECSPSPPLFSLSSLCFWFFFCYGFSPLCSYSVVSPSVLVFFSVFSFLFLPSYFFVDCWVFIRINPPLPQPNISPPDKHD